MNTHISLQRVDVHAIPRIRKRDGQVADFAMDNIVKAVRKALQATGEGGEQEAQIIAGRVVKDLLKIKKVSQQDEFLPDVEMVQDLVEEELMLQDFVKTAKSYILYREKRAEIRKEMGEVPDRVKHLVAESKQYFRNPLAEFVYYRTYARWISEEQRRETWIETVDRYIAFMKENLGEKLTDQEYAEVRLAISRQEAMPSMRLLQFSGKAARRTNVCAYNCSYIAPRKIRDFAEVMYVSMCGTGVGFSVESQNIQALPQIKKQTRKKLPVFTVADSKEGWADALTLGMRTWFNGYDIDFDLSMIRPAGSRLKTMGGKSSGPEPLRQLLEFTREKILSRQGRRLSNIDAHDILCKIGDCVVAGGVRRSAMISLSDLDDMEMRDAKKGQFYVTEPQRSLANNSAVYNEKPDTKQFIDEWSALMHSGSGERGIFNRGNIPQNLPKRRMERLKKEPMPQWGTNPCLTGDAVVYVADGRGNVSIKELADKGEDVPVFTYDDKGKVVVRLMRNPRLTGHREKVYRLKLDDGSEIKTTENHKFKLRTGEYKEVGQLKKGDSLKVITRFEASIKDMFPGRKERAQDYWWINNRLRANEAEHRAIAEFSFGSKIPQGFVVHHRDRNAQNNNPGNLEVLAKEAHDMIHGKLMKGDNNPMRRAFKEWSEEQWKEYREKHSLNNRGEKNKRWSGVSHEELREQALRLTRKIGRRFSTGDWSDFAKEYGLPQSFSKWRQDHLGGVLGLAKWAALELGYDNITADPRVLDSYKKYTAQGYDCEIAEGRLVINKKCEVCGEGFKTDIAAREHGVCGISCGLKAAWRKPELRESLLNRMKKAHDQHRKELAEKQAGIYSDLRFTLEREPMKKEWSAACRAKGISAEISRKSSPYRYYSELQEAGERYNHKVVSVEFVGYEDVYNGTVDEFHNFFVGGFEAKTRNGKGKMTYLNNLQCGEIILKSKQFCNLSEVVARTEDTEESLLRKIRVASILGTYQATLTNFGYLSEDWKRNCEQERLLGVSITGQWDSEAARDEKILERLRQEAVEVNKEYAKRFNTPQSSCVTCVKPSGTVSQVVDCASGMHPRHAKYYIRRIRISATDSLFKMLKDQGVPYYPEVGQSMEDATTYVLEFPVKAPEGAIVNKDIDAMKQLKHWRNVKTNYTEHNPSVTVSVGDDEWLKVADWLYSNWSIIGGLSFLPRSNHVYQLAPYEEIDEQKYNELNAKVKDIDFSKIMSYEKRDETDVKKELACVGGVCEI